MERALPIMAIVGLALAALAAMLITGPFAIAALAVVGIVLCVFLFLTRNLAAIILGALGALALIMAILGGLGAVSTEAGDAEFGIGAPLAGAFLVTGMALAAAGVGAARWGMLEPQWVGYVGAAALLLASVLAFAFMDELGSVSTWAFVVGLILLVALWPAILLLRAPGNHQGAASEAPA